MTPRLKTLTFAAAMLLVPGLGLTTQASAQSLNFAHGFYVQTTGATSSGAIRLASMKPRGPTFSDRVSYPRYLAEN